MNGPNYRGLWGLPTDVARRVPRAKVALRELGESLAATVAGVQQELASYPSSVGSFVLDEVELTVGVALSLDEVGQVRVRPMEGNGKAVSQLRLRLRPVESRPAPPSPAAARPLSALGAFSPEEIDRLEARRLFSVADFEQVARTPGGRVSLSSIVLAPSFDDLLNRSALLSLPVLPAGVAEALIALGVTSPAAFLQQDPAVLAPGLSGALGCPVTAEQVCGWQRQVSAYLSPGPG